MRFKRPRGESHISFSTALFSPEMSDSTVHPAPVDEGVPPPPPHPPPQLHVLAVDDSLLERMLIEKLLKGSAYRVTTVDSGKRALELLGFGKDVSCMKPKVNMIITDYCMPEMTGFDLLKAVKESSELREIPVVVVSSENVPTRISRCMEEGAEEFLLKPLRPSDVSRLHNHMLGMNRIGSVN